MTFQRSLYKLHSNCQIIRAGRSETIWIKRSNSTNPHQVLNIQPGATKKEIKEAYVKLSKKYHPDLNKSPDATAKFLEIKHAAESLLSPNTSQSSATKPNTSNAERTSTIWEYQWHSTSNEEMRRRERERRNMHAKRQREFFQNYYKNRHSTSDKEFWENYYKERDGWYNDKRSRHHYDYDWNKWSTIFEHNRHRMDNSRRQERIWEKMEKHERRRQSRGYSNGRTTEEELKDKLKFDFFNSGQGNETNSNKDKHWKDESVGVFWASFWSALFLISFTIGVFDNRHERLKKEAMQKECREESESTLSDKKSSGSFSLKHNKPQI